MLNHLQFQQLKKILQGNILEIECPCGVKFYAFSSRAVYHNNACRQKHFRAKQFNMIEEAELIEDKIQEPEIISPKEQAIEIVQPKEKSNEKLNRLIEKGKQYTNKLKTLQK